MGSGHSRMGMVYPRKWKAKAEKRKAPEFHVLGRKADKVRSRTRKSDDLSLARGHQQSSSGSTVAAAAAAHNWSPNNDPKSTNESISATNNRSVNASGPILAQVELSGSQVDFFRMLDEKIALGKDYNSSEEEEAGAASVNGSDAKPEEWGQHRWNEMLHYQQQIHEQTMQQQQRPQRRPHYMTPPEATRTEPSSINTSNNGWDLQSDCSSNVSENGERLDCMTRPGRTTGGEADAPRRYQTSTKPNGGNKSWFSDTYSAWPLRRIGAAFREDRSNVSSSRAKFGARSVTDVANSKKTVI